MGRFYGTVGRRDLVKMLGAAGLGLAATTACNSGTQNAAAPPAGSPSPQPAAQPVAQNTSAPVAKTPPRPDADSATPAEILDYLMQGNQRFVAGTTIHPRQNKARLTETGADQFPIAAFLSCADSRVPVETIFDQGIGDCFVTRVAGNVATPEEVGSLEFGTLALGAKVVMVIGHERCGAILAGMGRLKLPSDPGKIPTLVPYLTTAVQKVQAKVKEKGITGDDVTATVKENVLQQVATLNQSSIMAKLVKEGKLKIVGAYYDLDDGTITLLEPEKA